MSAPRLINLYDLTREQLRLQLVRWELNPVHVARLWNYLYIELAASMQVQQKTGQKIRR
jgi:23S rRNA (adenine2503-C2)-methyltransferase